MLPNEFVRQTVTFWSAYFEKIRSHAEEGGLSAAAGCKTYYPNILICTETDDIFLAELVGIAEEFSGLILKRHRLKSAELYVNQLPSPTGPGLIQFTRGNVIRRICLSHDVDMLSLRQRFPVVDLFPSRIYGSGGEKRGPVIQFGSTFESAHIESSVIVNALGPVLRAKHVLAMTMISRGMSPLAYREFLASIVEGSFVAAVHTVPAGKERDYIMAGQFQNLYLSPKLRETTIGEFLKQHASIMQRALSARRQVYEPYLQWIESNGAQTESAINPDLLLEREDGHFDIYDLKTAALDNTSITKGHRSRRRFIDYVEAGIAQLANYEEYFSFPKNREFAKVHYNVTVDRPRGTLVVGNFDNAHPEEISEACRKLKDITLIDYDTLTQLFLAASP
jgi:hypothetical protein